MPTGQNSARDPLARSKSVWDRVIHTGSWRVTWIYWTRGATRNDKTFTQKENRSRNDLRCASSRLPRFVTLSHGMYSLNKKDLARNRRLADLKGYVTDIDSSTMSANENITTYHGLWHIEKSSGSRKPI